MIDKTVGSPAEAVSRIGDGATVMIGGFGEVGSPIELIHALIDHGARGLTVINNGAVGSVTVINSKNVRIGSHNHFRVYAPDAPETFAQMTARWPDVAWPPAFPSGKLWNSGSPRAWWKRRAST